jgi:hypothetical protein
MLLTRWGGQRIDTVFIFYGKVRPGSEQHRPDTKALESLIGWLSSCLEAFACSKENTLPTFSNNETTASPPPVNFVSLTFVSPCKDTSFDDVDEPVQAASAV